MVRVRVEQWPGAVAYIVDVAPARCWIIAVVLSPRLWLWRRRRTPFTRAILFGPIVVARIDTSTLAGRC